MIWMVKRVMIIRTIRDNNGQHTCWIPCIDFNADSKTNNADLNNSQGSINSDLPSKVSCQKPNHSAD
jgi:hypothetical protein